MWYHFTDRKIRNEVHYWKAINYIHYNPIKHGWAEKMDDWSESSFHDYYEDCGREWLVEKWKEYQIGNFGKGWDD